MKDFEEALALILEGIEPLESETVALVEDDVDGMDGLDHFVWKYVIQGLDTIS